MYKFSHYSASTLIQQHREELVGYLVRQTRCPEVAADILQDAFLRLIHSESEQDNAQEEQVKNPRAFLFRIVSNLAIDYQRSNNRRVARQADESALIEHPDPTPAIEHQLYTQQQITHLKQAIAELTPRCREVFIMHKFKQYPYSVIMSQLGISESTVLKHIVKAMEHCRQRMQELE
ncbi:MAG: RNA polymerase sigma factor [Methylococcales bacterium]